MSLCSLQAISLGDVPGKDIARWMKWLSFNPIAQLIEEEKSLSGLEAGFCHLVTLETSSQDYSKLQGKWGACFPFIMTVVFLQTGRKMLRPPKQNQKSGWKPTASMCSKAAFWTHTLGGQRAGNPGAPMPTLVPHGGGCVSSACFPSACPCVRRQTSLSLMG